MDAGLRALAVISRLDARAERVGFKPRRESNVQARGHCGYDSDDYAAHPTVCPGCGRSHARAVDDTLAMRTAAAMFDDGAPSWEHEHGYAAQSTVRPTLR